MPMYWVVAVQAGDDWVGTVDLYHIGAPGLVVELVDVLRDEVAHHSQPLPKGQGPVGSVGLHGWPSTPTNEIPEMTKVHSDTERNR